MLLVSSSAGLCNRTIIPPPASLAQTSQTITVTTAHSSSYTHPRGWLKNGGVDKEIAKFKEVENVAFVVASALLSHAWSLSSGQMAQRVIRSVFELCALRY